MKILMKMKKNKQPNTLNTLNRCARRRYFAGALTVLALSLCTVPAMAAGSDPLTIVGSLSDFIFNIIKAIGVIILPIFMSLGIPKVLSVVSFMLSIGAGMFLNPVLFGQYTAFFLDGDGKVLYPYEQYVKWGGIALAVQLVFTIILILFCMRKKSVHSWAARRPVRQKLDLLPHRPC